MGFLARVFLWVSFVLTLFEFVIYFYERMNEKRVLQLEKLLKVFLFEFLSHLYLTIFWVFGFIPFENFLPQKRSKKLVVLIPGYLQTRVALFPLWLRLRAWNIDTIALLPPLLSTTDEKAYFVVQKVKHLCELTDYRKIILVGFGLGGLVALRSAKILKENFEDERKVEVITIGTAFRGTKFSAFFIGKASAELSPKNRENVKEDNVSLNIRAEYDQFMVPFETDSFAENEITLEGFGHFSLLFSSQVAREIGELAEREESES